jgi:hypothetical protein
MMLHNPPRIPSPFQFNGFGCPGCGGRCGGFG